MRWTPLALCVLVTFASLCHGEELQPSGSGQGIFGCVFETNRVSCARKRMAEEIDRIETQVTGRSSEVPMSKVIEEGGSLLADGIQAFFGPEDEESGSDDAGAEVRKLSFLIYPHLH